MTTSKPILAAAACASLLVGCMAPSPPAARTPIPALPTSAPASLVHELPSAAGRRYQVWIDLPASYATSDKPLPVVFVSDASWAFPIVRGVRDLVGRRGRNIEDFILVGLTHEVGLSAGVSRARDYTPSDPRRTPGYDPGDYDYPTYGEADAYLDYIETRVFPLVAKLPRADMSRRTYIGHSYGGLLGAHTLLTKPGLFQNYILGSPSLWFDQHVILRRNLTPAGGSAVAPKLFMLTGGLERVGPHAPGKTHDLVADMQRFEQALAAYGLTVSSHVAEGEDHLTVYPDVVTRGLIRLLPGRGPYDPG